MMKENELISCENSVEKQAEGQGNFLLERFLKAQRWMYAQALEELKGGQKVSHWIWYIFPQLEGLGARPNSRSYGVEGTEEAWAYLYHPVLGERLREVTSVLLSLEGKDVRDIFGDLDAMKVRSCMTLFNEVAEDDLFQQVLDRCYDGSADMYTLELLKRM